MTKSIAGLKIILVVEDNEEFRLTVEQTLQMENYRVYCAENGLEALHLLEQLTPDLILSDIQMPFLGGVDLFIRLQQEPRWASIPVIFMTADESPREIRREVDLNHADWLIKPVDIAALLNLITRRISGANGLPRPASA